MTPPDDTGDIVDVVQVGYGPVGQLLAGLLGRQGHRIEVFERYPGLYHLARAGRINHEVMRSIQAIGAAEPLVPDLLPLGMNLLDADHGLLVGVTMAAWGVSGWRFHYNFYQPDLEAALDRAVRSNQSVGVNLGWEVVGLDQHEDHVAVSVRPADTASGTSRVVRARYVIGADGANSFVREALGIQMDDLGYTGEWLVCDFRHHDPDVDLGWYNANQILDPSRPVTAARWIGREHSRLEFMLLEGEDAGDLAGEEVAWKLAEPFGMSPATSRLSRHAVYRFRGVLAQRWRDGRALLVGDAAHQMPPFMGEGMCSGLRDAANLAWKMDHVLRGLSAEELLDDYQTERRPHVEAVIDMSVQLGELIRVHDPEVAARRDAMLRSNGVPPLPPLPGLLHGVLHHDADGGLAPGVGQLSLQARVSSRDRSGLLDDVVGGGWRVLSRRPAPAGLLSVAQSELLERLGATVVHISPAVGADSVLDLDFEYDPWFNELGAELVVVRPDFYVFAALPDVKGLGPVLDDLARQLSLTESAPVHARSSS